jgi:hypothetical protein
MDVLVREGGLEVTQTFPQSRLLFPKLVGDSATVAALDLSLARLFHHGGSDPCFPMLLSLLPRH